MRAMTAPARLRTLVICVAVLGFGFGWACGRNEIDSPVDPLDRPGTGGAHIGSGGTGGVSIGVGGSFVGVGGAGGPIGVPCGSSLCAPEKEVCCASMAGARMCAPASDPNACMGGLKVGCV